MNVIRAPSRFPVAAFRFPPLSVSVLVPGPRSLVPSFLFPFRNPKSAIRNAFPGPRSRRNDGGRWRQRRAVVGQADSSALAVDSPGPLGRGGPRHPPSSSFVRLGGRLRWGVRPAPPRARRSPRRPGRKGGSGWPGAATSAWKAEATPRLRGAKAHEMGLRSRGQRRRTGSPVVGRGSRHAKDTRSPSAPR